MSVRTRDNRKAAVVTHLGLAVPVRYEGKMGIHKFINSVDTGGFKPGIFRVNPVTIWTWSSTGGKGSIMKKSTGQGASGDLGYLFPQASQSSSLRDTKLDSYALQKAYAKLGSAQVDAAVFLGELDQTVRLLKNPFSALKDFLKSNLPSGARTLTLSGSMWLQYRYGISPLLRDIQSAIKAIQDKALSLQGKTLSVRATASTQSTQIWGSSSYTQAREIQFRAKATMEVSNKSTAIIYYRLVKPLGWKQIWGLDAPNLPSVAWELLPWSFVADWFVSVGHWLSQLKAMNMPEVTYLGNCVSQTVKSETQTFYSDLYIIGYGGSKVTPDPGASISPVYTRCNTLYRVTDLLPPAMPVVNPSPLNFLRTLDSLALIWSKISIRR